MKAWQRQIREREANSDGDLFGRWWPTDVDIAHSEVKEIDYKMARSIIMQYEWLGTMPAIARHCFGIFFDGICGGAVVYGDEYGENLGVWDKYGYTGKIICLSRGACTHWSHKHSASRLIRRSMDLLPEKYQVVTATVDSEAGEVGTIYQACGFVYVGKMGSRGAKQPRKCLLLPNGQRITERQARSRFGSIKNACDAIHGSSRLFLEYKARYFAFRGDKPSKRKNLAAIESIIQAYPKRQSSEANTVTNTEARFDPALPLHSTHDSGQAVDTHWTTDQVTPPAHADWPEDAQRLGLYDDQKEAAMRKEAMHTMKDGVVIPVQDMTDRHLLNTIAMLRRIASSGVIIQCGGGYDPDEMYYDEYTATGDDALEYLSIKKYLREAKRRNLKESSDE